MNTLLVLLMIALLVPVCMILFSCIVSAVVRVMLPLTKDSVLTINNKRKLIFTLTPGRFDGDSALYIF